MARVAAAKWEFYLTGREAQEAMLVACESAQRTIDLEQYIFEDDAVGRKLAGVLIAKAQEGVRVRVLCDTIGSHSLYVSDLSDQMRAAGVRVQFFNSIDPWWLHRVVQWFLRNHRKLLIIDGKEGYTGGVGIAEFMQDWRDTHVMVTGPVVTQMEVAFERIWQMTLKDKKIFKFSTPPELDGEMLLVTNSPYRHQRFIYYAILDALKRAEKFIYITTPYFIPNRKLFRALKRAVARGVDVRLLTPHHADTPFVDLASRSYYWLTLRAGVKIYRYEPVMMHAKTIIVDDEWATVGSSNLDNLSLLLNYEDNIITTNKKFIAALHKHFDADLKNSKVLTQEEWHDRPIAYKTLELLTWPLHRLM